MLSSRLGVREAGGGTGAGGGGGGGGVGGAAEHLGGGVTTSRMQSRMASTICFPSDPEVFTLTAGVIALVGAASHSWAGRARALATSSACIRDLDRAALWVTLSSGSGDT